MLNTTVFSHSGRARLRCPANIKEQLRRAVQALRAVPREELSPSAAWIEDHALFLLEEADALGRGLKTAPALPGSGGVPRLLGWAREICRESGGEITAALAVRVIRREAGNAEILEEELSLLPQALSCALFERLTGPLEECVLDKDRRDRALSWARQFSAGERDDLPRDEALLSLLLEILAGEEDPGGLRRADEALGRLGLHWEETARKAREKRNGEGLETGRLISCLRGLSRLPFDAVRERLSPVISILRGDPTFPRMDRESRDLYVRGVCRAARRLRADQSAVARAAIKLAAGKNGAEGEAGYYLLERPDLIALHLGKRKKPSFFLRRPTGLFLLPLYGGAAAAFFAAIAAGAPWYLWGLILLCVSETLRRAQYAVIRRLLPARPLPRLRVEPLTPETRTLVVIPALLSSRKEALRLLRRLSVLRFAAPDPCLEFMLLADFADNETETAPEDEEILLAARMAAEELNRRQGGFLYLHRARKWDMGQRMYTGRERKRGALEALNRLLSEGSCADSFLYMSHPEEYLYRRYAYVITLDADTFMPPGAAYQLIGTMAHPLQKNRVGVIQPRMETAPDRVRTRLQQWLGGRGGADPYHLAVQDVYQDVFGRGSFVGKGIYEPEAWLKALEGRLPSGRLLSHDLIEGEIVGSALAEDIVLYDGHPARLSGWARRLHRWTRGDWQSLPFLADRRLSLLSRHKIWDNLRRSLVPASQTLLLLAGAALKSPLLCLAALPWPLRGMDRRLLPLPGKAYTLLDAAVRALYRQFVSHRKLLSWVTAAQAEGSAPLPSPCLLAQLGAGAALTALALAPGGLWPLSFLGLAWVSAPLWAPALEKPARVSRPMTSRDAAEARSLARRTWRFFEDSVSADTRFLPPDNVQEEPQKGPALRLSPTNAGLYLLSCCAAHALGFLPSEELSARMGSALNTLETLDTWQGHFYNWYDLRTGAPLPPRFVSTVDSGNCAACLLCCAQLLRGWLPQLPEEGRALPSRLDALARRMDFSALYDQKARLFYVGWEESARRFTPSHYDCLASEARLASFTAIMLGQIKRDHWPRLNRAVTKAGLGAALLSWGGTLFEYLLPQLLLPLYPGTLVGESCLNAVRAQMAFAPDRPFGISESGYYAFDAEMNYQYRAFGLPLLARSGETAGRVTAPYASMLSFPFFPRSAARNMRRMRRLGWQDEHGLFEAADYGGEGNEKPRLVRSHMAHHQAMILCALCNALENGALVRAFMALPAAQAHADLLWEGAPRSARRRIALPPPRTEAAPSCPPARPAQGGLPPETQLLSGGGVRWLLTPMGQGCLAAGDTLITRFDARAGSQTGPQFYVRDRQTGAFCRPAVSGSALFGDGTALFRLSWQSLRLTLRCCVDPLSGMAAAEVRAENLTEAEKEIEAVSFLEIALGSRAADEAHPNFRDLSVRVSPFGSNGLAARRLPRDERDRAPLAVHAAVGDVIALRRQGDRALFLGREGSYAAPEQLCGREDDCVCRTGDVIAPCLSLRARLRVPGEGVSRVYFLTLTGDSPDALARFPLTPARAQAAFALSAVQEKTVFRSLGMKADFPAVYRCMLGALLFYDQPCQHALPPARPDTLWRFGVSGALPVLLILLSKGGDPALIRHALRCHAWLRMSGEKTDLIFFSPPEGSYFRPLFDQARQLAAATPERDQWGRPGGLFWAEGDETLARALESLARLTLRSGQSVKAQLSALLTRLPSSGKSRLTLPKPLIPPELTENNGFGGFLPSGAYCVFSPAPAPWHHILCSADFGTLVCETGILHSWAGNSRLGRLTRLCPDPHRAPPSEEILLVDEAGEAYPLIRCAAVYEPGVASYRCMAGDVTAETVVFTHPEIPAGLRSVTLRAEKERALRVYWLIRFALGEHPDQTRCQAEEDFALAAAGDFQGLAWAAMENARCQALCAASAFGASGEAVPPPLTGPVSGIGSTGLFQAEITLRPREPLRLTLALGWAPDEAAARRDWRALLSQGPAQAERGAREIWARRLAKLHVLSFSASLDTLMNLWLPYQVYASRLLARMGPYQPGGAWGFRDQLQDCLALLFTDPGFVRQHILRCAAHQYREGDVQHWWHPPRRGVRTRITDDRLFLPFLTARYVSVTGDSAVLAEEAPYLVSAPLGKEEEDRYEEPEVSPEKETLLLHCLRALDSLAPGVHGLPLMGGGDWNDGMNRVGGAAGESVWLGFFLALTLKEFMPLCPPEIREKYRMLRRSLLDAAESAWTGAWYLRAWRQDGAPLAGPDTDPPRIDLITQCFAVLAGAPRDHAREALLQAVQALYDREGGLVKLLWPPFTPEENAGYIGAYLPGVRENGGQYTHAVPWLILALCRIGEYGPAWEIAQALLPCGHAGSREEALRYKIEPYVLAGDVYSGENRGRGGWSWYTGSAAWLYWAVLIGLMGFEMRGGRARLIPRSGPEGEEYTVTLRYGSANYHFTAARDTLFPTLDGMRLEDGWAPLLADGRTHEARFPLRAAQ